MRNYDSRSKRQSKAPSGVSILIFAAIMLISAVANATEDAAFIIIGIVILLVPIGLGIFAFRTIRKQLRSDENTHSHDRIDHTSDIQINPQTGKVQSAPVHRKVQHSAQEHWKQQLDGLLANGTIDKAEYKAMLRREF